MEEGEQGRVSKEVAIQILIILQRKGSMTMKNPSRIRTLEGMARVLRELELGKEEGGEQGPEGELEPDGTDGIGGVKGETIRIRI